MTLCRTSLLRLSWLESSPLTATEESQINDDTHKEHAITALEELGLSEYEAKWLLREIQELTAADWSATTNGARFSGPDEPGAGG